MTQSVARDHAMYRLLKWSNATIESVKGRFCTMEIDDCWKSGATRVRKSVPEIKAHPSGRPWRGGARNRIDSGSRLSPVGRGPGRHRPP